MTSLVAWFEGKCHCILLVVWSMSAGGKVLSCTSPPQSITHLFRAILSGHGGLRGTFA